MTDLQSVAAHLYGVPLGDFMMLRSERYEVARDAGDKSLARQVKLLRKPHAAAWAVNMMCREHPDLVHDVIDLGEDLREAQAASDGPTIRRLDLTRREVMKKVLRAAANLAERNGQSFTTATAESVEQTLWAAMLDPDVAGAVLTGLLVAPVEAGTEGDDLDGVLALNDPKTRQASPPRNKQENRDATRSDEAKAAANEVEVKKQAALEASRRGDALSKKREQLRSRLERLEEDREELRKQLGSLEEDIVDLEQDLKHADRDARSAGTAADRAERDLTRAQARASAGA